MTATKTRTKAPTVTVTMSVFDDGYQMEVPEVYRVIRDGVPIKHFADVTRDDYMPRGNTPLLDATAKFIAHLDRLRGESPDDVVIGLLLDESASMKPNREAVVAGVNEFVAGMRDVEAVDSEAGGKVLAVIFTDGKENASREVSQEVLRGMIEERERSGWTFIYMGANQDAWATGSSYGLSGGATGQQVNFASTPKGTRSAMASITSDAQSYLSNNAAYMAASTLRSRRSITEDGAEVIGKTTGTVTGAEVKPYGSVADALKTAKKSTRRGS